MMLVACPHLHRYLSKLFPHRASFRSAHRLQVHAGDCVDGLVAYVHTYVFTVRDLVYVFNDLVDLLLQAWHGLA